MLTKKYIVDDKRTSSSDTAKSRRNQLALHDYKYSMSPRTAGETSRGASASFSTPTVLRRFGRQYGCHSGHASATRRRRRRSSSPRCSCYLTGVHGYTGRRGSWVVAGGTSMVPSHRGESLGCRVRTFRGTPYRRRRRKVV